MISKKASWLLAGALSLASGIANAEMLTFHFKGTVTYGGTLASVGDEVTGHFCYDTDSGLRPRFGVSVGSEKQERPLLAAC